MTSVLSSYRQIDARVKFFYDLGAIIYNFTDPTSRVQVESAAGSEVPAGTVAMPSVTSSLLKDLGREVHVFNKTGSGAVKVAIWRQVQPQNGVATEGVPVGNVVYWVKTWSAALADVQVVRVG